MTDAPERIWLLPHDGEQRCWCDDPDPGGTGHGDEAAAYVRADLVASMQAENQRLREVLETIATTGRCEFAVVRAALRSTEDSHD